MLTEQQLQCIELLAQGTLTNAEIAKKIGYSERVIYDWKKKDEFKDALHKRTQEFKQAMAEEGQLRMAAKGQMALDNIVMLANNANSEKVMLDANVFIWENVFGKATTKVDITKDKEDKGKDNFEDIDNIIDNVIDIEGKKKAK
ncbi:hypothetical protein FYJ27_08565 [Anaerosalibacter bizertensis]|uniref:Homeodomain phBC6A51-type domain-containing protein n=1 Tax=Anaerosalibacter bizertensis TaxID=932217 RepID=A0A844FIH4_9FIRM|nr:phBC6A51 family helix-turn-helix protein [Anaerosalibacter bizertensis]MSS43779.1 hypothetical protein [Anaerosalibacter bizertensis]